MKPLRKIYPGMLCGCIEFFADGTRLKYLSSGEVKNFNELPYLSVQLIREAIAKDPAAQHELMIMHPDSETMRIEQWARCNFSGLDFEPDISNGILQEGEYWDCPLRGNCSGEGKICKPLSYRGHQFLGNEIKLIKLLVTGITNESMAEYLLLPLGTFHLVKKKLYEKLGVQTKQEIAVIALELNLI